MTTEPINDPQPVENNTVTIDPRVADLESQVEALKKHNEGLIKEQRSARQKESEALEQKARATNDYETLNKIAAEREASLTAEIAKLRDAHEQMLLSNAVNASLNDHKVGSLYRDMTETYLKSKAKVVDGQCLIDGQPLGVFMANYMNTEQGKAIAEPSLNIGSGATGSNSTADGYTKDTYTFAVHRELIKTNPMLAKQLGDKFLGKQSK
ncbi:hypothetical protein [Brevundimonas olei]